MIIRHVDERDETLAGDGTTLRELLHGPNEGLPLRYSLAWAKLPPDRASARHRLESCEVYYFLAGEGRMTVDGKSVGVLAGDAVVVPPGATQHVENTGKRDLEFLCIVDPGWRAEDEEVFGEPG
jgi:mannose-6-phosphate isomerase-like protein (cupin superfamily)